MLYIDKSMWSICYSTHLGKKGSKMIAVLMTFIMRNSYI